MTTGELLAAINAEDRLVAEAVRAVLPQLERVVDLAVAALRAGRAVHYLGSGTSGRLAVLDAVELRPTFDAPPGWFVPHLRGWRGGDDARRGGRGGRRRGRRAGGPCAVRAGDLVVGVAASGRTPWVLAGLAVAREVGRRRRWCAPTPGRGAEVDVLVGVGTGPEVLTGSTRMKAGTAQKLVLNAVSTAVMVRMGRTWSNLMVTLVATNDKLRERSVRILVEATGSDAEVCRAALDDAGGELRVALVAMLSGAGTHEAAAALEGGDGHVAVALETLRDSDPAARQGAGQACLIAEMSSCSLIFLLTRTPPVSSAAFQVRPHSRARRRSRRRSRRAGCRTGRWHALELDGQGDGLVTSLMVRSPARTCRRRRTGRRWPRR